MELEIGQILVLVAAVAVLAAAIVAILVLLHMQQGDAELRSIRGERQENERSADRAAKKASEHIAVASSLGREVRHTRRQLAAEARVEQHRRELDSLAAGVAAGAAVGGAIPPPPGLPP